MFKRPLALVVVTAAAMVGAVAASTGAAATGAPVNTSPPTVSGNAVVGSTLTASTGTWTASPTRYTYRWRSCASSGGSCTTIANATAPTYLVAGADAGRRLRAVVAAHNAYGYATARSALTAAVVTATSPSDTTPPTAPATLVATPAQTSVTLSWAAATDNVSVTGYRVYAGTSGVGTTGSTSYTVGSLTCGSSYSFAVSAYDAAGNESAKTSAAVTTAACSTTSGLSGLRVSGNHLVDGSGAAVRLHGVNYSGTEYACIQGWGIFDGPSDSASVKAIASWHSNIVHLGLNEDCILGINGVASQYGGSNYMNAIVSYVNLLHQNGLYAEVSLMWAAPGTQQALDHPAILDQDHAPAALQAIANAFKNDPNTIIGLQSEPHGISWSCWRNGGSSCSVGYTALGMQGAVNAVRSTGATNVVTASGIDYANNLSSWLANRPSDSANALAAEAHVYGGNACASTSCFDTNYAPVAAAVPMVFGETGETYDDSSCGSTNISTFMNWADAHGVGYEAWVWDTWGTCGSLISDFNGTPANQYATWVHDHYLAL